MQSSEQRTEDDHPMSEDAQSTQQTHSEQKIVPASSYNEDAIRRGLIYPPPPDFYISMPEGPQSPPPAVPRSSTNISPRSSGVQISRPFSLERTPLESSGAGDSHPIVQQENHPPVLSSYPASQPYLPYTPRKPSYAWVWLLITGLAILIFGSCALATWLGYSMFGSQINNQYDANTIGQQQISKYYGAIQAKNYIQAYSYLHPEGSIHNLTQAQFVQQAQQQDAASGEVLSFNPGIVNMPESGDTFTSFQESVEVGRVKGQNYNVNLTFQKIGSHWYITDFNRI